MLFRRPTKTSLFSGVKIACSGQACGVGSMGSDVTKCLSK